MRLKKEGYKIGDIVLNFYPESSIETKYFTQLIMNKRYKLQKVVDIQDYSNRAGFVCLLKEVGCVGLALTYDPYFLAKPEDFNMNKETLKVLYGKEVKDE